MGNDDDELAKYEYEQNDKSNERDAKESNEAKDVLKESSKKADEEDLAEYEYEQNQKANEQDAKEEKARRDKEARDKAIHDVSEGLKKAGEKGKEVGAFALEEGKKAGKFAWDEGKKGIDYAKKKLEENKAKKKSQPQSRERLSVPVSKENFFSTGSGKAVDSFFFGGNKLDNKQKKDNFSIGSPLLSMGLTGKRKKEKAEMIRSPLVGMLKVGKAKKGKATRGVKIGSPLMSMGAGKKKRKKGYGFYPYNKRFNGFWGL